MITVEDIETELGKVLHPDAFGRWWMMPVPSHGNRTPFEIWSDDGSYEVYSIVLGYSNPSFS